MKKRTLAFGLALVLLLCLLAGCGGNTGPLPDSYVPGSDYQLYLDSNTNKTRRNVQEGDGVIYLYHQNYVYYLDEKTGVILPLCSKADCLHDKETDPELIENCNAYVGEASIQYCNGYLYALRRPGFTQANCLLQRISDDGSRKDELYEWGGSVIILYWVVHRDVMYYKSDSYSGDVQGVRKLETVYSVDLKASDPEPELLFDPSTLQADSSATAGYSLLPYGNHIYMDYTLTRDFDENFSKENQFDYLRKGIMAYDITTGELSDVQLPDMPYGTYVLSVYSIWRDRLILNPYNAEGDDREPIMQYTVGLDGTDVQPLMESANLSRIIADEKYLYVTNSADSSGEPDIYHDVYDENLNKIDSFTVPSFFNQDLPVGTVQRVIAVFESTELPADTSPDSIYIPGIIERDAPAKSWGVLIWDKSKLGTYNGGEISFDMIFA